MTFALTSRTILVEGAPDRSVAQPESILPNADEVFISNSAPLTLYPSGDTPPAWGTWVGAFPRLATADQATSYGQATGSVAAYDGEHGVGVRHGSWAPPSNSTPVSAVVEFEAWCADPVEWAVTVRTTHDGTGSFSSGNSSNTVQSGWVTGSVVVGITGNTTVWNLFVTAAAAGNMLTYLRAFNGDGSLYGGDFRVSRVALKIVTKTETFLPTVFGRTGCDLLPDGSYVVACYADAPPTDLMHVWKVSSAGDVLGHLLIDTEADDDGRAHVIALDGDLVQVLYMTGNFPGGISWVVDCSGDTPVLVATFDDNASTANGYGAPVHHLYLRGLGVVAVCHRMGTSIYRRGRHLLSRSGTDATGEVYGMFPHPTDERKFAAWFSSGQSGVEYVAWEYTITSDDAMTIEALGPVVLSEDVWWVVGGGNPYAAVPLVVQELDDNALAVTTAADPATTLWSTGANPDLGINSENISCQVGDSTTQFAFSHEAWHGDYDWPTPDRTQYTMRCGLVDASGGGAPVVQVLDLEYGATSPSGYPDETSYVSLLTGSMSMAARNGELVVATCLVEEEGPNPNYYSVISWKLSLGGPGGGAGSAKLSGTVNGSTWREGINNATGRLGLQTSQGMLPEASAATGLDAPAKSAYVQTSTGWELLGRFVVPGADLPDPVPPTTLDVTYVLSDINTDIAAAIALAGSSFTQYGNTWGPFVEHPSPPAAGALNDSSDASYVDLANVTDNVSSQPVEVFTARLVPLVAVPAGAQPIASAWTVRGQAAAGDPGSYLDAQVTTSASLAAIRGQGGLNQLQIAFNLGPEMITSSYGIAGRYAAYPDHPGRLTGSGYTQGTPLAAALSSGDEMSALWWAEHVATSGFYVTVQNALTNPAHGPARIAELSLTIRYLVP